MEARVAPRGGSRAGGLYHEEAGEGVPVLLIHPSGATASTWGAAVGELARVGRVIAYDRRGYERSPGGPVRSMATHTADAAAVLESLEAAPAVVVGTSAGAAIAVDLAVRRPDLVRAVVAHEFPWRYARHPPTASQAAALAKIGALVLLRREREAAEVLLRSAYAYRDGGSAWEPFRTSGVGSRGRTPEPPWRTSGARSASTPLRRTSRPSACPSCAATAHAVPSTWPGSYARWPRLCPERRCA